VSELHKSGPHKSAKDVRKAKLEAALKENLRRRKAQARARKGQARSEGTETGAKEPHYGPNAAKEPK
jgi:hypothetical protein